MSKTLGDTMIELTWIICRPLQANDRYIEYRVSCTLEEEELIAAYSSAMGLVITKRGLESTDGGDNFRGILKCVQNSRKYKSERMADRLSKKLSHLKLKVVKTPLEEVQEILECINELNDLDERAKILARNLNS